MRGIAIDPGVHGCGFAAFEHRRLVYAQYTGEKRDQVHGLLGPVVELDALLRKYGPGAELVIEKPKIYRTAFQKGDQRDLIDLTVVVGSILHAAIDIVEHATLVEPATWKGQVKKEETARRVTMAMTVEEWARIVFPRAKSLHHNVFDAIGIGLWRWRT